MLYREMTSWYDRNIVRKNIVIRYNFSKSLQLYNTLEGFFHPTLTLIMIDSYNLTLVVSPCVVSTVVALENRHLVFRRRHFCALLCLLGNFACFFVVCRLFFKIIIFSKNSFRNTIRLANSLDPNQAQHFVGPDLGPNCLQRLSADSISRQS